MDTDALRWFQQVADGVTVTEVSEVDGVSQPECPARWPAWSAKSGRPCCDGRAASCG
jgi:hypothetical protein